MNGDGIYSWKWQLVNSGRTMVPSERVTLTDPFNVNGKKLMAAAIDSAGTLFTCNDFESDTSAVVGFKAPNFSFTDISDTARSLSAMHGKIVLVTFWSTSCPFCEKIRPGLNALVQHCDPASFQSIAAAADSDPRQLPHFFVINPMRG